MKQCGLLKLSNTCSKEEYIPSLPQAHDLRKRALALVQTIDTSVWALGEILKQIMDDQSYLIGDPNYATFNDFCEGYLQFSGRKGRFYAAIFVSFYAAGLDGEVVNKLGSAKCRLLARVITKGNAEELVKKAEELTFRELEGLLKEEKQIKAPQGQVLGSINIPYHHLDTLKLWQDVKGLTIRYIGCESNEAVLEALAAEFIGTYGSLGSHDQDAIAQTKADYEILKKYDWKCANAECGRRLTIAVHHIEFRSQRPDLIDEPENKLPLCLECHDIIHNELGDLVQVGDKWAIKKR